MSYSETETYSQAGAWLMGTARRNPEALLLLAAGCCLLMRSAAARPRGRLRIAATARIVTAISQGPAELRLRSAELRRTFARGYHAPRTAPPTTPRRSRIGFRIPRVLTPSQSPSSPRTRAAMCPSVRRA